jgi:chromatin remodeling complex protein RSC6
MAKTSSEAGHGRGKDQEGPKKCGAGALARPVQPDDRLSAIVGGEAQPRTEITKRVWDYIRKHGLQDTQDKRMINADETLSRVLEGKKQVSMFELTKLVNKHVKAG